MTGGGTHAIAWTTASTLSSGSPDHGTRREEQLVRREKGSRGFEPMPMKITLATCSPSTYAARATCSQTINHKGGRLLTGRSSRTTRLRHDLSRGQVAQQPHPPRLAEGAPHPAPNLRGTSDRSSPAHRTPPAGAE